MAKIDELIKQSFEEHGPPGDAVAAKLAKRDDVGAIPGEDIGLDSPATLPATAPAWRVCAALIVARGRGAERSWGKTRRADDYAARGQNEEEAANGDEGGGRRVAVRLERRGDGLQ